MLTTTQNEIEATLIKLWEQELNVTNVTAKDDFFDLGGHSLVASKLIHKINQRHGIRLPFATFFRSPTIEQIAGEMIRFDFERSSSSLKSWFTPVFLQTDRADRADVADASPIFLFPPSSGTSLSLEPLARHFNPQQTIYSFDPVDPIDSPDTYQSDMTLQDVAKGVTAGMRSQLPAGPIYLGGICQGAHFAFEVSRLLVQQGIEVARLFMLDAAEPANGPTWTWATAEPAKAPPMIHLIKRLIYNHQSFGSLRRAWQQKKTYAKKSQTFRLILSIL